MFVVDWKLFDDIHGLEIGIDDIESGSDDLQSISVEQTALAWEENALKDTNYMTFSENTPRRRQDMK